MRVVPGEHRVVFVQCFWLVIIISQRYYLTRWTIIFRTSSSVFNVEWPQLDDMGFFFNGVSLARTWSGHRSLNWSARIASPCLNRCTVSHHQKLKNFGVEVRKITWGSPNIDDQSVKYWEKKQSSSCGCSTLKTGFRALMRVPFWSPHI